MDTIKKYNKNGTNINFVPDSVRLFIKYDVTFINNKRIMKKVL